MTYQIFPTSSGWYYDLLDENGFEITTRAYFQSELAARLSAEAELYNLNIQNAA